MHVVYNSKGDVLAGAKGAILSRDLFQGFGGGALRTPFYTEVAEGGLVSAREFFDEVEKSDFDLDDPCQISSELELSLPVQMCSGFVSSGAPTEGEEMGSGGSVQPQQGEERGRFDDSEEEEEEDTRVSQHRLGDRGTLRIPGAERGATVVKQPSTLGGVRALGSKDRTVGVVSGGEGGEQHSTQKRRGGSEGEASGLKKKQKTKIPQQSWGKRKGVEGHVGASSQKRPASAQKPPQSAPVQPRGVIDIDAAYFLEWKNGVRTKREFAINPSQVIDIGVWEAAYNQCSLDPVEIRDIIDAMTTAYSQAEKTYELPTLKLAPLGLVKPTPGVQADRLKPEDWKDELAGQYYYYAVAGQHNAAAARALLGTDVAVRYNFERWPARMVYFSDEDFEGYFLVSAEDNKKDLKAPPRQLKLSMRGIRWCWKELGYPKAVMGNLSRKQAQVEAWRRICAEVLQKTSYNHLWTLADDKTEQGIKKQNAALRFYFPLAMAEKNTWETGMEFFKRWETGRLLAPEGAKWIAKKKKVQGLKLGVSHIENEKDGRKSYGALIDAGEESLTSVVFDTGAPEEDSDTEEIDIDYRLAPVLPSPASSSASPSTNQPAQATPVQRTPSKLLARLTPRPAASPPLRPGCQVPLQHPSRKDENIHFEGHDHTRSTEADWGHDMIWHPGTIQPAIRKGEWVMAIVDTDGEWKPSERLAKSDYLDIARSAVVDKVTLENSNLQPADSAIIATADRLFRKLHDKQWLELSDDFYDLEMSPSKKKMNWKVPPSTGTQGSVGEGPRSPPGAGGGGGSGHEEGGRGVSGHTKSGGSASASSPGPGDQGRIVHSGVGEGGVNVTHSPTAGSGKSRKFARIRTSQTEDPVPVEAAKSAGIRTSMTLEQAALPSWTAFGSSAEVGWGSCEGDPVSAVKGKSAGIPTRADDVQASVPSEEVGTEEGPTSVRTDDHSLGSAFMRLQGAKSRETDGGEEWVKVEGGEEGGEWEEGGEGDEGRETELITLRDDKDSEEGGLSITDEERVDAGDEDVCGETSDSFGLVYARPGEGDIDDDATAMKMEMQVVSGLSVDHEEYDAHHQATAVRPPDGGNEAIMTVSLAKMTRRLSVKEVIDTILGGEQVQTLSSTPSKDDALVSNETFVARDLALIQPWFPVPSSPLTGGRGGGVGGGQHVTSPKKCRVGTPALAVLALLAPTSPTKEQKEKQAGKH
ncbi:hypothetical protein CBR_g39130 [Chara braunii]|uniref:Uncharacterized protein n=1 Tax=Chara braunii TaxID=69332 RepID=A0A388LRD0_CHABU|nr:hypothetical protein CBR_g39130 [Chara braunii]|eukprot:GBG84752.1 hypothetical protein CBR_g39130 [Chara braunii]